MTTFKPSVRVIMHPEYVVLRDAWNRHVGVKVAPLDACYSPEYAKVCREVYGEYTREIGRKVFVLMNEMRRFEV